MSTTKIGGSTTNTQNKCTLWQLNLFIWKTKLNFHKQYLFGLLFSRNVKKTHVDQIILQAFLLCLKRNVSQIFKSSSCKKVFHKCVCYRNNLLWGMFFIPCDKWKKFSVSQRFGATAMLLRSWNWKKYFERKYPFYFHYLCNNMPMLPIPKVQI